MRILFLSYFYPGPLGAMASWLADRPENRVVFASSRSRQELALPHVQRIVLRSYKARQNEGEDWFSLWDEAIRAGKSARKTLEIARGSGFDPDIILCAASNGSAFGLREIFPDSFIVNFLEESAFFRSEQAEMRRCLQYLQILEANLAFAFSEAAKKQFPPALQAYIRLAPMVIDATFFSPESVESPEKPGNGQEGERLVTFFGHGLTEQELFHAWHAALEILASFRESRILFILQGTYPLRRLASLRLDPAIATRLHMEAHLRQDQLRDRLCASSACVFPGKNIPFGLLEAMSCASCPMCANAPYFLKNGWDMLELPPSSGLQMADRIITALKEPALLKEIGARARQTVINNFGANVVMPRFFPEIEKACAEWNGA